MRYFKLIFFKERDEEDDEGNKEGRHEWRQCDVAGMRPSGSCNRARVLSRRASPPYLSEIFVIM